MKSMWRSVEKTVWSEGFEHFAWSSDEIHVCIITIISDLPTYHHYDQLLRLEASRC